MAPTGSSSCPRRPCGGWAPGSQSASNAHNGPRAVAGRVAQEDAVDREAHEHHVDPVAAGEPEGVAGRQGIAAHEASEVGPQRSPVLDIVGEKRTSGGVTGRESHVSAGMPIPGRNQGGGRRSDPDGRCAGAGREAADRYVPRFCMIRITAGPRMTMNSEGKMHPTSGNSILIGALAAISSARCRRSMRSCSD